MTWEDYEKMVAALRAEGLNAKVREDRCAYTLYKLKEWEGIGNSAWFFGLDGSSALSYLFDWGCIEELPPVWETKCQTCGHDVEPGKFRTGFFYQLTEKGKRWQKIIREVVAQV